MKQKKCPLKKGRCWDYGDCEGCDWNRLINKYERKIARLEKTAQKAANAQADKIAQLEQDLEIARLTKSRLTIFESTELYENARKETAQELLKILYDEAIRYGKGTDGILYMANKYGVEVK